MRRAASALLLLVMGAAAALLVSGRLYVVRSSSMVPAIEAGDAILVRGIHEPPDVGEIVLYEVQGQLITHRVVDVEEDGLITQGDANEEPDPWVVSMGQVRGRMILRLPYVGWFLAFLRQPGGWLLLVVLPALAFVLVYGHRTWRSYRGWRSESRAGDLERQVTVARFAGDTFVYLPKKDRRWWNKPASRGSRCVIGVLVVVSIAGMSSRGSLGYFGATHSGGMEISTAAPPVSALVDVKPEVLQIHGHGDHLTAFIRMVDADVRAIDVATVRLCVGLPPCDGGSVAATDPMWIQGGHVLKVRFDRADVSGLLGGIVPPADVIVTVSGIVDVRTFAGSDLIRVVGCGLDEPSPEPSPESGPSPSPDDPPTPDSTPSSSRWESG